MKSGLRIGLAQIAPVFLDRAATLAEVAQRVEQAAQQGCDLIAFPEILVPGYPVWVDRTDGARFESADQKQLYDRYLREAVVPEAGHLDEIRALAARWGVVVILGIAEAAQDRGGHTIYCSRVFIDADGRIASIHRKLMPTYEERLVWGAGDGHGLVTHAVGAFTVGALNCWENWMPLTRASLYAQGMNLHVASWPGAPRNTENSTPFFAFEGRSYVASVSGILRPEDIPEDVPLRSQIIGDDTFLLTGGSAVAGPDGRWVLPPVAEKVGIFTADIDISRVRQARQSFDPAGHYARPDVFRLTVDRRR
ncbi:MAG: carbon-nitrogen hydrolase family protein, partial [Myxococcota bacterium]